MAADANVTSVNASEIGNDIAIALTDFEFAVFVIVVPVLVLPIISGVVSLGVKFWLECSHDGSKIDRPIPARTQSLPSVGCVSQMRHICGI